MADTFNILGIVLGFFAAVLFLDEVIPRLFAGVRWDTNRLGAEAPKHYPQKSANAGIALSQIVMGSRPLFRPVRFSDILYDPHRAAFLSFLIRHDNTRKARGLRWMEVRTSDGKCVDPTLFAESFQAIQRETEAMGRDPDATRIRAIGIWLLVLAFGFQFIGAIIEAFAD